MGKTFDLSILLKMQDLLTRPMRKMSVGFLISTRRMSKSMDSFEKKMKHVTKVSDKFTSIGKDLSLKITAPLMLMGGMATKKAIEFESAFAGVRKTVDATKSQYASLKKELMDLALVIPLSTEEIFGIAEAAGQLGIKRKDIASFTKVMADLGATTNMTASEAATSLARFANVMGTSSKDYDKLGSVIVDLGNNLATTEAEIVDMAMRLAGAGKIVGLSEENVLSLAGALSSLGIRSESGGTAFSQVMRRIDKEIGTGSKKIKDFALIAKTPLKDFEKLWKKNTSEALILFVEGLKTISEQGGNVNIVLDELGMEGIRISDSLLRAANSGDKFRKALARGNTARKENNALTKEANERYKTEASQLKMIKNRTDQLAASFGDAFKPMRLFVYEGIKPLFEWFKKISTPMKTFILFVGGIAALIPLVLIGIGGLIFAIGAITTVTAPIIPIVMGIGAALIGLAGAFTLFSQGMDDVKLFGEWLDSLLDKTYKLSQALLGLRSFSSVWKDTNVVDTTSGIDALQRTMEARRSQTDVNIKVSSADNVNATVEKVKTKTGNAKVNVATVGYVGASIF